MHAMVLLLAFAVFVGELAESLRESMESFDMRDHAGVQFVPGISNGISELYEPPQAPLKPAGQIPVTQAAEESDARGQIPSAKPAPQSNAEEAEKVRMLSESEEKEVGLLKAEIRKLELQRDVYRLRIEVDAEQKKFDTTQAEINAKREKADAAATAAKAKKRARFTAPRSRPFTPGSPPARLENVTDRCPANFMPSTLEATVFEGAALLRDLVNDGIPGRFERKKGGTTWDCLLLLSIEGIRNTRKPALFEELFAKEYARIRDDVMLDNLLYILEKGAYPNIQLGVGWYKGNTAQDIAGDIDLKKLASFVELDENKLDEVVGKRGDLRMLLRLRKMT
jgi:hypothetical protein